MDFEGLLEGLLLILFLFTLIISLLTMFILSYFFIITLNVTIIKFFLLFILIILFCLFIIYFIFIPLKEIINSKILKSKNIPFNETLNSSYKKINFFKKKYANERSSTFRKLFK